MKFLRENWIALAMVVIPLAAIIYMIMSANHAVSEDHRLREEFAQKYNCKFTGYSAKDQKLYTCDDGHTYLWWDFPIKGKVYR